MRRALPLVPAIGLALLVASAPGETIEQIISREHPDYRNDLATLTVGRDGLVYLGSGGNESFVIRLSRDGKDRFGGRVEYALRNATANAQGIVATASGHFAHKVTLYDADLGVLGAASDFLVNDTVGWDAPSHVEAGESGDFYGADQHRDRILRITPGGRVSKSYAIPRRPEGSPGLVEDFRVSEKQQALYVLTRSGDLRAVGFDGAERWSLRVPGFGWNSGGFDLADDGTIYATGAHDGVVRKISADGKTVGEIKLQMGDRQPQPGTPGVSQMRLAGAEVLLKRSHPTEMFQRYALATGERLGVVETDHERLTVAYPSDLWTAGEAVPFTIDFNSGGHVSSPRWRVWLRPLNHVAYQELLLKDGRIQLPEGLGGIYQVKVTPEAQPWERGAAAEYVVRGLVEVRRPDAMGSLNVLTPGSRVHYGRGEEIVLSVVARTKGPAPASALLQLLSPGDAEPLVAQTKIVLTPNQAAEVRLSPALTRALRPGEYRVVASAANLTPVAQPLVIGRGTSGDVGFLRLRHGDYGATYPSASFWNAADIVAAHVEREGRLGFNAFADRIGSPLQRTAFAWDDASRAAFEGWAGRLERDPAAAAPQAVQLPSPFLQTMAAYSAAGMRQMAILLMMDAGLPIGGPGHDPRKPDELEQDIRRVTGSLVPYQSFRGWSWHSNWWIYEQRGPNAAETPEDKSAYEAALKEAKETGKWAPVLEKVARRRLGYAVEAQEMFNRVPREAAPQAPLKTASAGTYRNVESYPPISFGNVDEVDLQGQFEQIFLPYFPVHAVDFYRRPGKPVWGHPEVWNDSGTGEQVLPELFSMLMRAPDGMGPSGDVPPWTGQAGIAEDPRLAHFGTASVFRALNGVLERYGPWVAGLETDDPVAIVASPRQFMIDEWGQVMGVHFARLMEAYVSCLHAHYPASIVFVEDLEPDTLKRFKAVLLVDQWVEMEPELKAALASAKSAGVAVLYDGTCRKELVSGFTPLGISFDKFEKDKHPASDDAAYFRFPQYVRQNLGGLSKALGPITEPVATIANPEVWASRLKSEHGRYLFVVNNTSVPLEPSRMWRTTLHVASLLPVVEPVKLTSPAPVVYDAFAMKQVTPADGAVTADLRHLPARVYAILPEAIESVALRGPGQVEAGQPFAWSAAVLDGKGRPIAASVPLRVRLLSGDGSICEERFLAASSPGVAGEMVVPVNAGAQALTLEALELLSGRCARLKITPAARSAPPDLAGAWQATRPAPADADAGPASVAINPSEQEFGPHLRDLVVSGDGKTAVVSAMNWDHNVYGIDTATGEVRWREKLGHYFAFAPRAVIAGVALQGFDYNSAEGYHLYLLDYDGKPRRRFALFGLPRRLPHRFVPALVGDRDNPVNNFAVPADASWVASAGNLGLAVWDAAGKLLWKQEPGREDRRAVRLASAGNDVLLVADGVNVSGHNAKSGKRVWQMELARTGVVRDIATSADGKTIALLSTTQGGRVSVLRDGKVVQTLNAAGDDIDLSTDGTRFVLAEGNQLNFYTVEGGLAWTYSADDRVRNPRLDGAGARVAFATELGTVYVTDESGQLLHRRDNRALTVPAWLGDGDLLLANWMGRITRLDASLEEKWTRRVQPGPAEVRPSLSAESKVPTARMTGWGNAAARALPLTPNLLTQTKALVKFTVAGSNHVGFARPPEPLTDGRPDPPAEPWLDWGDVNGLAESHPVAAIELDTFRTQVRVNAITFVEDPSRPDSWLRDATLESWDASAEHWAAVQPLLSDAAVHTHELNESVEAARFRVLLPRGFVGNLRLGEVVLHGEALGASHPDVVAKRPVAVLLDDSEAFKDVYPYADRWSFVLRGAYSGGRFLQVNAEQHIAPTFYPTFGHTVPDWDFEIVENPGPGQYRYLQWAWKALSPQVQGATLELAGEGGIRLHAGKPSGAEHVALHKVADAVPSDWQTQRVDLWEVFKKPTRLRAANFGAVGGPVGYDQLVLGRTEDDLKKLKRE